MATQRRRPQAPNSIPVAAPPPDDTVTDEQVAEIVAEAIATPDPEPIPEPEQKSAMIATDVGVVETKEQPQPQSRTNVVAPKGIILGPDDPITIDGVDAGIYVVCRQDVYREVFPRGARRPSYFLLYRRGQRVLKSTLVRK